MAVSSPSILGLAARTLTILRLLSVVPFAWLLAVALDEPSASASLGLAVLYVVIAASDFLDGRLARAAGSASAVWGRVDVAADVLFNAASLSVAARLALVGPWLPGAVLLLGTRYLWRSVRADAGRPRPADPLGRIAGVLFYAMVGLVVAEVALGAVGWLPLDVLGDLTTAYALVVFVRGFRLFRR